MSFTDGMPHRHASCYNGGNPRNALAQVLDIDCSIQVPIDLQPTRATMPPVSQRLRNFYTTTRTVLRCTIWVHCHRESPSTFSLESHYVNKFTPASVQNRLAQSRSGKPSNIQVFMSNDVIFSQQPISNLVVEVFTLSCYFLVVLRQSFTRFLTTMSSLFLLTQWYGSMKALSL